MKKAIFYTCLLGLMVIIFLCGIVTGKVIVMKEKLFIDATTEDVYYRIEVKNQVVKQCIETCSTGW